MSPSQQLTISLALSRAKKAAKQGNLAVAQQLYQAVLQHQPLSGQRARHRIRLMP